MRVKLVLLTLLLAAVLGSACSDDGPSAPSPAPSPGPSPAPPPAPDVSTLLGVWNLMVRVTAVSGSGCVADTMRSRIGVPERYSLSITQRDKVEVTLRSASTGRACAFTPFADRNGFSTYGQGGSYTCEPWFVNFQCTDGTQQSIFTFGENISGGLSGIEMTGRWDATWFERQSDSGVEMKAEYTGAR